MSDPSSEPPIKPKKPRAPHTKTKLTLKERAFVNAIATPGSPTFGNGTQSALKSGYGTSTLVATRTAYELRRKPYVETAIDEVFNKHNLSLKVRTKKISDILDTNTVIVSQHTGDGTLVSETHSPNHKMQLQAIHMLNKMDGTYARAEAIGHAQGKAIEPLIEEYTRKLRAELRSSPNPPLEADSGARENDDSIGETETPDSDSMQPTHDTEGEISVSKGDEATTDEGVGGMPGVLP